MWFTYLILCKDNSIYTGITNDLERRFSEHQEGRGGHYTSSHKPIKFLYSEQFNTKSEALKRSSDRRMEKGKEIVFDKVR